MSRRSILVLLGVLAAVLLGSLVGVRALTSNASAVTAGSGFTAVTPCRMFDTRFSTAINYCDHATAVPATKVGPNAVLSYTVTGSSAPAVAGIPANASALVLNVTAVDATAMTFVSVYPDGTSRPGISNVNVNNAAPVANMVTVPLVQGTTGKVVDFYNSAGRVDILADVTGYFAPNSGAGFTPLTPCRVFDTRDVRNATCSGAAAATTVTPAAALSVTVSGVAGVPTSATAVVLNLTAVNASQPTAISVSPHGAAPATASSLDVNDRVAVPNLVTVPIGTGGMVDFRSSEATVDLLADIAGYYASGAGYLFTPVTPCRVYDTRTGTGTCQPGVSPDAGGKDDAGHVLTVPMPGIAGIPVGAKAVALNVTAVGATAATLISAFPDDVAALPGASNLNVNTTGAIANSVVVGLPSGDPSSDVAPAGLVDFYNQLGSVSVIVDVFGYYS